MLQLSLTNCFETFLQCAYWVYFAVFTRIRQCFDSDTDSDSGCELLFIACCRRLTAYVLCMFFMFLLKLNTFLCFHLQVRVLRSVRDTLIANVSSSCQIWPESIYIVYCIIAFHRIVVVLRWNASVLLYKTASRLHISNIDIISAKLLAVRDYFVPRCIAEKF